MREDIMTRMHRQRIAIEPTLIRAQRLRQDAGEDEDLPIQWGHVCVCCHAMFEEGVDTCPKRGGSLVPLARLGIPMIGAGIAYVATDPELDVDNTDLLGQPLELDEDDMPTMQFTLGLVFDEDVPAHAVGE